MNLITARSLLAEFLSAAVNVKENAGREFLLTPFSYPNGEIIALSVEYTFSGWGVTDVGSTDGFLAERGINWDNITVRRAIDEICRWHGVRVECGCIIKDFTQETFPGAVMSVVQAAQAIAGAAYVPKPRMPKSDITRSRARVRTQFFNLLRSAGLQDAFERNVTLIGRSKHPIMVSKAKTKPVVIFSESLRNETLHRAEAMTFEWLDLKANGIGANYRAACIYDPPESGDSGMADADRILTAYFEEGAFPLSEKERLIRSASSWISSQQALIDV